jgi:hypothetical protein
MNRILKFRAWDKLAKQFTYPDKGYQGHYVLSLDGKFQNLQNGSGGDEYVVQQFTGLKDKNGKELYEGDRVTYKLDNNYFYSEIKWKDYTWFIGQLSVSDLFKFDQLKLLEIEIIGNVFELPCNPDHNGECLVCDAWLSDCQFLNKEPEYHLSPKNLEWLKQKEKAQEELQKKISKTYDPMWQKPLSTSNPIPNTTSL